MAITNITTANQTTDETDPIDCSIVVTDGAGNNRKVIVFITEERVPTQTVVPTLNGVSGVLVRTESSSALRVSLFEWNDTNLPATSGTYTVSWAVNGSNAALSVLSCSGAKQISCACPSAQSGFPGVNPPAFNLVADANSVAIIGFVDQSSTAVLTPGANQVDILATTDTGSAAHAASYNVTNLTLRYTRLVNNAMASVAAAIEPYYEVPVGWTGV
ncbi:MAG: hypothetical protein ACK48U_15760, partial [Planctomyces sp.]|jgi:hypothetical protein